jgi:hypothetical protein
MGWSPHEMRFALLGTALHPTLLLHGSPDTCSHCGIWISRLR